MTDLLLSPTDLAAFEDDAASPLPLPREAQDLLFRTAATATCFADEPVTETQMRAVYDLMKWAPTAMNSQPLRIVLVRSDEARARLAPHLAEGNRAKTLTAPLVGSWPPTWTSTTSCPECSLCFRPPGTCSRRTTLAGRRPPD